MQTALFVIQLRFNWTASEFRLCTALAAFHFESNSQSNIQSKQSDFDHDSRAIQYR